MQCGPVEQRLFRAVATRAEVGFHLRKQKQLAAVIGISHRGQSCVLQMGANLVFSIRLRITAEQREAVETLHDFKAGSCIFPSLAGTHDLRLASYPANLGIDLERVASWGTVDKAFEFALFLIGP